MWSAFYLRQKGFMWNTITEHGHWVNGVWVMKESYNSPCYYEHGHFLPRAMSSTRWYLAVIFHTADICRRAYIFVQINHFSLRTIRGVTSISDSSRPDTQHVQRNTRGGIKLEYSMGLGWNIICEIIVGNRANGRYTLYSTCYGLCRDSLVKSHANYISWDIKCGFSQ